MRKRVVCVYGSLGSSCGKERLKKRKRERERERERERDINRRCCQSKEVSTGDTKKKREELNYRKY